MSNCTYRFKDASGKEVVITGQDNMKAFLAEGGLKMLMPEGEGIAEPSETPQSPLDAHAAVMDAARAGTATPEQVKASFASVVNNAEAIKAELSAKTKAELLKSGGSFVRMRYGNDKKAVVVDAVYDAMIGEYTLGQGVSYGMGKNSYESAVKRLVDAIDAEALADFAQSYRDAVEESKQRAEKFVEAIKNPQSLDDFRTLLNVQMRDGKTRGEAFLTLTPEQRIRYDELEAEATREAREARKRAAKTEVRAAGQTTGRQIIATKHTRDGYDLFVVQLSDRLGAEDYKTVLASAKRLGGWYSSFRGNGAIPGFQFKDRESADAFLKLAGGDTADAKAKAEQRRDAFSDDRSQTAVERLREMAGRLDDAADEQLNRDRKANTARRARFASAAINAAESEKALAKTMRNIAQAIDDGKAKFLDAVRTKTQVEALSGYVRTAKDNELRSKYPSYADQEKRKGEPATAETADFAEFPSFRAYRSDLASLARQMIAVDGTKKLGQKLMSVADDVTDAYMEFAKQPENLDRLSTFSMRRGDEVKAAIFQNREAAERAIRRSGLTGKAIVLPEKRGVNWTIMSPSEAMNQKIWKGDGDKLITLTADFGNELVEAIGRRGNKHNGLSVPWQFQTAYDRRKALSRIGIDTPSEFRSALRELIGLQVRATPNKVREMELKMVGRKSDGLDFFPTPAAVADQMVEAADITPDMAVLEPSAGMGHIADRINEAGVAPDVVEMSEDRRELLEEKGYELVGRDFMDVSGKQYDRIIMNPPFSNRRDAEHVRHAYDLLKPDGRIVAIMGEGVFFGQDRKAQEFRDWLESVGGTSEKLPDGSFLDPSLPVNTGVNARMVVIDRPASEATKSDDAPAVLRTDAPDTQPFREWFAGSKMKDKDGEPLLFMHGTPAAFDAFDSGKLGTSSSHTSSGLGHFFTRDRATAERYADGGNIYEGWLRIENPYVMPLEEAQAFDDVQDSAARRKELQKQGYDGVVILDDQGKQWATVAFEPWQFKSTDNNGSFDEFDDRMRFRDDPSSMRDATTVPRDQAEEFIRKFVAEYPGAPQIMLADSFYQLPEDIQSDALEQGSGPTRAKGALKNGKAYVVLNTHTSMADLEASVFHEVLGHAGIRKLLGPAFAQELNKMFIGLGGYSKLYQIMSRRGMGRQFEGYYDAVQRAREKNPEVWTEFLASSILTEEVFAHIAEQKNAKALRDRFMALVGMVRDWLRRNGFARLASLGESDIVFLLQRARAGLKNGSGVIRDGVTIGETVIVDAEGRPVAKKGSPDYEMLKAVSERMGLRETNGPTVFSNSLPEEGKPGDDARMDDALTIDGVERPTKNSKGQPIHPTEEGIRNFWKWFGGDGLLDEDGRPMLVYHGGGAEFSGIQDKGRFGKAIFVKQGSESGYGDVHHALYLRGDVLSLGDLRRSLRGDEDNEILKAATQKDLSEDDADDLVRALTTDENYPSDEHVWDLIGAIDEADAQLEIQKLRGKVASMLGASAVETPDEFDGDTIMVVDPMAIKSATGNAGTFDPSSPITVFRTVTPEPVRTRLADLMDSFKGDSAKTFNWWQRTIGSQYGKAKSDRDFGRVYDAAHAFLDGVADFAKTASTLAPNILPHLDTMKDVAKGLDIKKQWSDSKDYQAVSSAIFEGTLANGTTGKVWSDAELQDRFNLNQQQIDLYREFRKSVDFSLDTLAASELARLARASQMDVADRDASLDDALSFYLKQLNPRIKAARAAVEGRGGEIVARHIEERATLEEAAAYITEKQADLLRKEMQSRHDKEIAEVMGAERKLEELRASFTEKVEQIRKLQSEGYAPLMRFGQYTVDVVKLDANGKPELGENGEPDRPFFGMFETESEARRAAKALSEDYPDHVVTQGVLSVDASQLYKGVTPETAEMFARMLGTDKDEAFQTYLKQAVANRSAMKRLIHRLGIDGFSNDVPRVLASFITSNARLASGNWHFGEMAKAVEAIPKQKGDVKDEAIRLMQYVQNPQEEAAGLRGFLFFSFLGGSIASAMVNLTQTFSTTLPYLHQFGGAAVAKALPKAMALSGKMMTKGLAAVPDGELKDALKKASDEGVVDPQEIHLLMAESGGNGSSVGVSSLAGAINKQWATPAARVTRSLTQAWGMFFGAAEKYNRHVAFIAAWEVAPDGVDRYEFAKNAVTETQFDYTKASRPNWARGAVGATLFTFKTFMVNYVEFMSRLPPRERALALAVLFLMAGMSGMPGADDLDDVVDTVAQKMGYNWNNSAARHAWLAKTLTAGGADFVERGLSSLLPLDVSARLGMGNIVPGTGILMKSNDKPARDIQEFFGPIASVFAGGKEVFDDIGSGKGVLEIVRPIAPKAYGDLYQAVDMIQTGQYRDRAGRKVVDVSALDATLKAIGFQPNAVAGPRRIERMLAQSAAMHRAVRQDIHELMARGRYENDADKVAAARGMMKAWNEKNPETPIRLNPTGVATRVRAMRQSSADRLVKATPKDMRGALSAELAVTP